MIKFTNTQHNFRAVLGIPLAHSENGIYLEWFEFFLDYSTFEGVILFQDSHAFIHVKELAHKNGVYLPAHTTHIF